uniref:Glycosyl hydrolase family 57 n=1 Tax=Candidatus Kentrum eta TaxID=2126337 RepID=A0A450UTN7_9GAMM|nr:MAG: Glycosyl hydrolase family 57 [Candidatus Kentron sp. H]VFJ89350.1 MAG: Glycosyl hydrolase family 57 [Candidatus Kentron sp. H]VFJ95921.1 MAG: Glycosyl hydrolase family 57 [Candidatus Kentron sp. H]
MQNRYHATILNLHQPPGNLEDLLVHDTWKAKEIMYALDRIPRAIWGYEDIARIHLPISGALLETLSSPDFQSRTYGYVKCGDLLWNLRNPAIDLLATGYYHPVFPLIPPADREEQLLRWFGIARHLFEQQHFQGLWPPEMGFCMEMIPMLRKLGFRYVLVDSEQVVPLTPMSWHEIRYRPHIASFGGDEIIVVVRDRDLSNSQEAGMDPGWFIHEIHERTQHCDFPSLVTTASDGDNGGWFRNTRWDANFWGAFYRPLMRRMREGTAGFMPTFIQDYLDRFGAEGYVIVRTGAWNTGEHSGIGFVQWTGSAMQKDAMGRAGQVSRDIHELRWQEGEKGWPDPETGRLLEDAMWRLLRAETSCHFYWGEDWVHRAHGDLDQAAALVGEVKRRLGTHQ